jgi:type III secretion protein V
LRHTGGLEDRVAATVLVNAVRLITPEMAAAVWHSIAVSGSSSAPNPPSWFTQLVRDLVVHRVRPTRLGPLIAEGADLDRTSLFEAAVSTSPRFQIAVDVRSWSVLRQAPERLRSHVSLLATGVADELGLPVAIPGVEVDPALPDHHFAVTVGDLRTLPLPGLEVDQIIVNDTRDHLESLNLDGLTAQPAINPATGQPCAAAPAMFEPELNDLGLTTWSMTGYIILTSAEVVRRNAGSLYHGRLLRHQLDLLAADHRVLSPMIEALGGVPVLTRILRRLLREGVPIHHLPMIVTRLHGAGPPIRPEPGTVLLAPQRHLVDVVTAPEIGDPREASFAETARGALSRSITARATRGTMTLVVYILAPNVERRLNDPAELTPDERRALLEMIAAELVFLPPTAQLPLILTRARVRARLRSVIEIAHPRLQVIAYEELDSSVNIQPVARLSLPE